jgi:hypothetical protein
MWKPILAGTAVVAIAGSSLVYAQQQQDGVESARHRGVERVQRWRPSPEDAAAFADARIAALKAGLRLTPEQERNWPAFEAAARDYAGQRRERFAARRNEPPPASPVERLRRGADALAQAGASMKRLADAQEPLYNSLDESQKRRFAMLSRLSVGGRGHGFDRHRHWRDRIDGWRRRTEWRDQRERPASRPVPMTEERI